MDPFLRVSRRGTLVRRTVVPFLGASLVLAASLAAVSPAFASDESTILRARAADLGSRNDCAAALPLLEQADRMDPSEARSGDLLRGRCLVALERFEEAVPALERAASFDPNSGEAALALGIARYRIGEKTGAYLELQRAESLLPNRPEPPLFLGMILMEREESSAAAAQLERSGQLNGASFDPISSYYAGLAYAGANDAERSEEMLRRVRERGAGTVWGDRAAELLSQAEERRANPPLNHWLTFQGGLDYDTNFVLRGTRIAQDDEIDSDDAGRGWWGVDAGTEVFRKDGWAGGVGANYTGSEYFPNADFGQHFLSARFWIDRSLGENTLLRITPEGGLGWFRGDDYIRFLGVRPEVIHDYGDSGVGTFYGRYAYNDFRLHPDSVDHPRSAVNRDGHDVTVGYDHQTDVLDTTTVRGGVFGRGYWAEGSEYDSLGVGGWLGMTQTLPLGFTLDLRGGVAFDDFSHNESDFLEPGEPTSRDREDVSGTASAVLSRPITDWLTLAARYQYLNNDSSVRVFDYDRHIVGAFFTLDVFGLFD